MSEATPQPGEYAGPVATPETASAGIGVTEADIDTIRQQLAKLQKQADAQAAASAQASADDVSNSVDSVNRYLEAHNDEVAQELGAAAAEAAKSGDLAAVADAAAKLRQHLEDNPPYPGENYGYNGALSTVKHLPKVISRVSDAA